MYIFRKKITEERKKNLEKITQEIVNELKIRGDIECIFYYCYKEERNLSKTGNIFYIQLAYNGELTEKVKSEFRNKYSKKYLTKEFMDKTGMDICFGLISTKDFKLFNPNEVDFSKGYPTSIPFYEIRALYVSTIIYDKDGLYNQIAHQFDEYYDMRRFTSDKNKIDIDINIENEISKSFEKNYQEPKNDYSKENYEKLIMLPSRYYSRKERESIRERETKILTKKKLINSNKNN